jgi:pimeloyl-ACP methyl ester carboxylesterase
MAFGDRRSLARYLTEQGFEVWVPELRGAGLSAAPPDAGRRAWAWDLDTLIDQDVPAILSLVLDRSGAPTLDWVGHSMGGMVIFGHLSKTGDDPRIRSVFALASPGDLTLVKPSIRGALGLSETLSKVFSALDIRVLGGIFAPFGGILLRAPQPGPFVNADNMESWVARRAMAHLLVDVNLQMMSQFGKAAYGGRPGILDRAGETNYLDGLSTLETPAFFAAGSADGVALPDSVQATFEAWGGDQSEFKIFGRNHGDSADYGHGDIVLGPRAPDDVFPRVRDWLLRERQGQGDTSSPAIEGEATSYLTRSI